MSELLKKYESIDQSKLSEATIKILNRVKTITADFTADDAKNNDIADKVMDEILKKNPDAVKIVKREPKAKPAPKKTHKAKGTHKAKATHKATPAPATKTSNNNIMSVAKEIQKTGESWKDAMERAKQVLKERKEENVQKGRTEMEKLLALVRTKKELQGFANSDIKRDSVRTSKVKGSRVVTREGFTSNQYKQNVPNKLGRKYWESRENRSDRLAPNYQKDMPLLAKGGVLPDEYVRTVRWADGNYRVEKKTKQNDFGHTFNDVFEDVSKAESFAKKIAENNKLNYIGVGTMPYDFRKSNLPEKEFLEEYYKKNKFAEGGSFAPNVSDGTAFMDNAYFADGGGIRSKEELKKIFSEKENLVKNLTPSEIAEMWNKNSYAVKQGISKPVTVEEATRPSMKIYLQNLLIENELTDDEQARYFANGGSFAPNVADGTQFMNQVYADGGGVNDEMYKLAKSIVRGTDYKIGVYLPFRTDFYLKDVKGRFGIGSYLVLQDEDNKDEWSVSERKYNKSQGGYYEDIKSGITQKQAYELVRELINSKYANGGSFAPNVADGTAFMDNTYFAKGGSVNRFKFNVGDKAMVNTDIDFLNKFYHYQLPPTFEMGYDFSKPVTITERFLNSKNKPFYDLRTAPTENSSDGYVVIGSLPEALLSPVNSSDKDSDVKIKDWYTKTYPTDDLGEELNDEVTFEDMWNEDYEKYDIYQVMGVGDSLIRERLFEHLAEIKGVDYGVVYRKLFSTTGFYADGGSFAPNVADGTAFMDNAYFADGAKLNKGKQTRPLYEIAQEIRADWKSVYFGAKPYLSAMSTLNSIDDNYGYDNGRSIVNYFLANAKTWRGEKAKIIKAELNSMVKYANGGGIDGGMNNLTIQEVSFANGGSVNMNKHIWEGWTVGDFIEDLEPQFNQIMSGGSWQKPFKTKDEVKAWCVDNQPYYKKNIPDVVNYFWAKVQSKDNSGYYAKGGSMSNEEKLLKELRSLQRDLNSSRLGTYREGDNSEEQKERTKEREVKLARFNEVLKTLRESDAKFADGGGLEFMTDPNFGNFQNTGMFDDGGSLITETVSAIFNPNQKSGRIETGFGSKTKEGLFAMMTNVNYSPEEITTAVFVPNAKKGRIYTEFGAKTKEGLHEMVENMRNTFEHGGSMANLTEQEFLKKYFGANVFTENPSQYFEIKKMSSDDDAKVNAFVKELKADGFTVKKRAYSDFTSVMGVKKKNSYELGGAFMMTDLAGHTGGSDGLGNPMPLSGVSGTHYTGLVGETGAMSSGELFARGGGVGDNVLGLKKGDIYKVIDTQHTAGSNIYTFIDYVDKDNNIMLKSLPFPPNPKKKNDFVYVYEVSSDGIKVLNDEEIGQVISRKYKNFVENNYEAGGAMMQNQQVIDGASQNYVITEAFGNPAQQLGMLAKGGAIKNQYEGRTPEDVWDNLTIKQKEHFLHDHFDIIQVVAENGGEKISHFGDLKGWAYRTYKALPFYIVNPFITHTKEGQYASGGSLGKALYVEYSSWFISNKYDEEKIMSVLQSVGAKNIRLENDRGWFNQPEVVVFNGDKNKAQEALNEAFDTEWIRVSEKDWRTKKMADGGDMGYFDNMSEEEILKSTVVFDNNGESYDRYTVYTPDGSVFGMSEDARGFNQYVGEKSEIPMGKHLGKKLSSVPQGIRMAVLNRMKEEYANGGSFAPNVSDGTAFMDNAYFADGGVINGMLNKKIQKLAEKKGLTMDDLGRDEYNKVMTQALVESLTDANFHDEAKQVVVKAEGKTKWSDELYQAESFNPDEQVSYFAREVARECDYTGDDILNAYFFVTKMQGSKVAGMIDNLFLSKNPRTKVLVGSSKKTSKYIDHADINYVTLIIKGKTTIVTGSDVLNGANLLEDGGDLSKIAFYVPKRDVVSVKLKNGETIKPVNGYWVKKDYEPVVAPTKTTKSGKVTSPNYPNVNFNHKVIIMGREVYLTLTKSYVVSGDGTKQYDFMDVDGNELVGYGRSVKEALAQVELYGNNPINYSTSTPPKIDESKAHFKMDLSGGKYEVFVDSNFVNQSQGNLPNTELKHLGFGEFYLETPDGNIDFIRTSEEKQGFVGRSHKMKGNDELVLKLVNAMKEKGRFEANQTFADGGSFAPKVADGTAFMDNAYFADGGDVEERLVGTFYYDSRKDKTFRVIYSDKDKISIQYFDKSKKPIGKIEDVQRSEFEYLTNMGAWAKYKQSYFADGGSTGSGFDPVKVKVVLAVGLDRAIEFYNANYPIRPYQLLERGVRGGYITLDEINERVVESALETAQDSEDMEEVGSSDFGAFMYNFLDEAGFKVGRVNGRLTREYADGGNVGGIKDNSGLGITNQHLIGRRTQFKIFADYKKEAEVISKIKILFPNDNITHDIYYDELRSENELEVSLIPNLQSTYSLYSINNELENLKKIGLIRSFNTSFRQFSSGGSFAPNVADGTAFMDNAYFADGGEIRRFDRQEQMNAQTRGEILDIVGDLDIPNTLKNYLYGLYDGYDYSQTERFKEEMKNLKSKDSVLHDRINAIYKKIDKYKFEQYDDFANGGEMMRANIDAELEDFDLDNLDDFETMQYNHIVKSSGKVGALQILINTVEGDYSQLSPDLAELAEMQMSSEEYDEATRQMRFERDGYAKGGMTLNDGSEYEGYNLKDINGKKIEVGDTIKTTQPSGGLLSPADSEVGVVEKTKDAFGQESLQIRYRKQGTNYDRLILLNGKINEIVKKSNSFADGGSFAPNVADGTQFMNGVYANGGKVKNKEIISSESFIVKEKSNYDNAIDELIPLINKSLSDKGLSEITTNDEFDKYDDFPNRVYVDNDTMIRIWDTKQSKNGVEFNVSVFKEESYANGGGVGARHLVGEFNEQQLRKGEDKIAIEKAQKQTGLTYIQSKVIKKSGKPFMQVYLISNEEYYKSNEFADGGMFDDNDGFMRADNERSFRYPEREVRVDSLDESVDLTSNVSYQPNKVVIRTLDENIDLNDDNRIRARMGSNPMNRNPNKMMAVNQRMVVTDLPMPTSHTHKND